MLEKMVEERMLDLLMEKGVEDLSFDFDKIWKMKVPPRVRSFSLDAGIRKTAHNRVFGKAGHSLPANEEGMSMVP
ncbi:hypothetical protein Golax_016189 [Gossypium laxum]|uniref:Uncharacterized protein n=1 Tax=Gossypium laxum TaxID=34288 RepID=A0A7J8YWF8_9ROSI|nr:hypothetical protein [Gossypium laxum]